MNVKIVGCGLSGATAARLLTDAGHSVTIFETRNHIAGNCYDSNICGTLVHNYGPHIFHTDDEQVYAFLSRFTEWFDFKYQPKGITKLGLISLPYSQKTIKELGRELSAEEITEYFFREYSEKQWGVPFDQIPKSITNRIPKTNTDEDPTWYRNQKYQCIPKQGYTKMFERMLNGIIIKLSCAKEEWEEFNADVTVYTGKIDEYFRFIYGRLPYRSLNFMHSISDTKLINTVYNINIKECRATRIYDHSYFNYNHNDNNTVITTETPVEHTLKNIPFYPIPWGNGIKMYNQYKKLAEKENNVIFLGRLATYTYLDMWMAVKQVFLKLQNISFCVE